VHRRILLTLWFLSMLFFPGCSVLWKPDFDTFLYRTGCVIWHTSSPEETLDFFYFPLGGVYPELMKYEGVLKKIKVVTIRNSLIDKNVYELLKNCDQLKEVGFECCWFAGDFIKRYFGASGGNLEFVWFRECEFGEFLFDSLSKRKNVQRIVFEECRRVTADGLAKLGNTDIEREVGVVMCKPITKSEMKRLRDEFKDTSVEYTYSLAE